MGNTVEPCRFFPACNRTTGTYRSFQNDVRWQVLDHRGIDIQNRDIETGQGLVAIGVSRCVHHCGDPDEELGAAGEVGFKSTEGAISRGRFRPHNHHTATSCTVIDRDVCGSSGDLREFSIEDGHQDAI